MNYQRFFKSGQQLLLKVQNNSEQQDRTELMTAFVVLMEKDLLTLNLSAPYGINAIDHYPFSAGISFEVTTEAMGLGVRTSGSFIEKTGSRQFTLKLNTDTEMFQRRVGARLDCQLGIRFSRVAKDLPTMRKTWEKNLEVLYGPEAPPVFENLKKSRINISAEGMRFSVKPPANQGDLSLVLIHLDDGKPPICAIAETVWSCALGNDSAVTVGMRFINILNIDQQRISHFISTTKT